MIIGSWRDDYDVDTGRKNLDPAKLGRLLRRADQGDHRAQQEAFSACLEDPHVHTVVSKRIRRVLSRQFTITAAVEDDAAAEKAAELCRSVVLGEGGEGYGICNWREALWHLGEAVARGFALSQIVWDHDGSLWRPVKLKRWMARDTQLGDPRDPGIGADRDVDEIRILTAAASWEGEPLDPYQWIVHVRRARSDALAKCALLRMCVWWWLFKHFSAKDWVIFAERYGMPLRLGKYPLHAGQTERDALLDAVITLGKDGGAIMPEGAMIELVEAVVRGEVPYQPLITTADAQISKAVLGQTLTTEAGTRGARSLGEVHQDSEKDIANDDGIALAETIHRCLLTPIVRFNMPEGTLVPSCAFLESEQEDKLARAQRDKILIKDIRLPVGEKYLYETYDIPPPADGEALVNPPADPPPFGGKPGDGGQDPQQDSEDPPGDSEDPKQNE